jgi:hypothetical protein
MIERDYKLLINTLSKMTNRGLGNWVDNLLIILWADRFTIRRSTRHIPFYLFYNRKPILPIKLKIPIWRIFLWDEIYNTAKLFTIRARQI